MHSGSLGLDLFLALALGRDPVLLVHLEYSGGEAGSGLWELLGSLEAERMEKPGSLRNVIAPGCLCSCSSFI